MNERRGKKKPDPSILKIFSENLLACIGNKRELLATNVKISTQAVGDYVNGKSLPRADILCKIAESVDRSVDWLLTGKEPHGTPCSHSVDCPFKDCDKELLDLCKKVKFILDSEDTLAEILKSNIHAYKTTIRKNIEKDEEIADLKQRVAELEAKNTSKQSTDTG